MSYYTKPQRHSEVDAASIFQELWPNARTRRAVALLLADFVRRAAERTSAWSVVLNADAIKLDVGRVQLLRLWGERVSLYILGGRQRSAPGWLEDMSGRKTVAYKSVNVPSRELLVPADRVYLLPRAIRDAALRYIDEAASRRGGKSSWARAHSPGVLAFLRHYLRINLPEGEAIPDNDDLLWRTYLEGERIDRTIAVYERSSAARTACIALYGYKCAACDRTLGQVYGPIAAKVIHVHHLRPLQTGNRLRSVDPLIDLRPICPNCHAVAHARRPPLSINEVRALLAVARKV